jgi:hypothetical protein
MEQEDEPTQSQAKDIKRIAKDSGKKFFNEKPRSRRNFASNFIFSP